MKQLFFIFLILTTFSGFSQDVFIFGTVKSDKDEPLPGTKVSIVGKIYAITNIKGFYSFFINSSDSVLINIKLLGCNPVDTLVYLNTDKINLNITLHPKDVALEEVEITAKAYSLFTKENWTILDYIIDNKRFIVLATEIPNTNIYIFNLKGKLLSKNQTEAKYTEIFKSCMGGYHLVGITECREFSIEENTIIFKERYTKDNFNKYLEPCQFKFDSFYIFKRYSYYNKIIDFYYYDKPKSEKILYQVINKEGLLAATRDLYEILNLYYQAVSIINNDKSEYITYDNLIANGEWTGNLDQLNISFELMFAIMWFKNISSSRINAEIFYNNDKLYVLDFENFECREFSLYSGLQRTKNLTLKCKKNQIIKDIKNNNVFVNCNNAEIFMIDTEEMIFSSILKLGNEYLYPMNFQIYDNELFFMSYDNVASTYCKMHRIKM